MTNSKNKLAGVLLAALMTVSAVTAPTFITTNDLTEPASIVQTIEANAATLYAPKLTNGHYIIGYCTSDSNVPVYADKNFKKRGASTSKYGNVSYYNAYISGGSDEIKIYAYTSSYCYVSYPAGKTTKFGYIKTSAVFPMNETKNAFKSSSKETTYRKSNLKSSYGYVDKGDTVYLVGTSGNNYKIIYNISGSNWKTAWISQAAWNRIIGYVPPLENGAIYYISPACATGSLLDISGGASNKKDGANVQIYTAHKGTNQQFKARLQSDGSYIFEAVSSGKVLDVNIKTDNVTQCTNKSGNNQKWYLKSAGNGYYYVVYYWNTSYCLDVSGAGSKDGTNVQIYPSNGTNAQKFKFTKYISPIPNDYNPTDAINYAKKYWQNYNPSYKNLNPVGGDCANFVSQCLKAGGLKTDKTWSPYTYAWVNCEGQLNYLGKYYQVTDWAEASDLRVGDVVYYYNGSKIAHTAICTKVSNGQAYVTAHNKNHIDYEWTLGGSKWWGGSTRRVVVHMSKKK